MSNEKTVYRMSQLAGWFGFVLLIFFQNLVNGHVDAGIWKVLGVNFVLGIGLSHGMRWAIIKSGTLELKVIRMVPRLILLSIVTGLLAALVYALV